MKPYPGPLPRQDSASATAWQPFVSSPTLPTYHSRFEAFGNLLGSTGSTPNPYRYVGWLGYYQTGSSLMHLGARYYMPEIGRFISPDPSATDSSIYSYGHDCPVSIADPTGLWGRYVHRQKTEEWARTLGFCARAAALIAYGDQDIDLAGMPREYHQVDFWTGRDDRPGLSAGYFNRGRDAAKEGRCAAAMLDIGRGLHPIQDTVAHGNLRTHPDYLDDINYWRDGTPDPGHGRLYITFLETKAYLSRALSDPSIKCCVRALCNQP